MTDIDVVVRAEFGDTITITLTDQDRIGLDIQDWDALVYLTPSQAEALILALTDGITKLQRED